MYKDWVVAAGATVLGTGMVAVSARVSYAGEGLDALAGATLHTPCVLRVGHTDALGEAPRLADGTHVYLVPATGVREGMEVRRCGGAISGFVDLAALETAV